MAVEYSSYSIRHMLSCSISTHFSAFSGQFGDVTDEMAGWNIRLVAAVLLITISLWLFGDLRSVPRRFVDTTSDAAPAEDNPAESLSPWRLKPHGLRGLSPMVEISTLYLQAVSRSNLSLELIEEIDVELPPFALLDKQNSEETSPFEVRSLSLPSIPPPADASSIIFGVATTLERLDDSLDAFSHWAAGTGATIVALVPPPEPSSTSDPETSEPLHPHFHSLTSALVQEKAHALSIKLSIYESSADYITRYISLLSLIHDQATTTPTTKWASIIDDDTFFLSTPRLLTALSKYNATYPHYVGGLTEDLAALSSWGYLAYGGAGLFLSIPLLTQLQPYLPTCLAFPIVSGDGKLAECIYRFTTTKLSVERGLNQVDLFGDHTGFYEAVRPLPVSVHHWKSWGHYDMLVTSAVATVTGQDSLLQKFHLRGGWWMTHGFSIVKFSDENEGESENLLEGDHQDIPSPRYLTHREGGMERTFTDPGPTTEKSFLHSLEPLRPRDEGKIQYMIETAVVENSRTMSLYYVRRVNGVGEGVIRVIWTRAGR